MCGHDIWDPESAPCKACRGGVWAFTLFHWLKTNRNSTWRNKYRRDILLVYRTLTGIHNLTSHYLLVNYEASSFCQATCMRTISSKPSGSRRSLLAVTNSPHGLIQSATWMGAVRLYAKSHVSGSGSNSSVTHSDRSSVSFHFRIAEWVLWIDVAVSVVSSIVFFIIECSWFIYTAVRLHTPIRSW